MNFKLKPILATAIILMIIIFGIWYSNQMRYFLNRMYELLKSGFILAAFGIAIYCVYLFFWFLFEDEWKQNHQDSDILDQ